MTEGKPAVRQRRRGFIQRLPSGSLRVKVFAGTDPLTGRRLDLTEVVPPGPAAAAEAEKVRTRLLNQIDEQRNPRTKATVNQLMDRYLEVLDVDVTTRKTYEGYIRLHVRPLLGKLPLAKLDGEVLDSFYAILRRCRTHCGGRPFVEHLVAGEHDCTARCRPHQCRPLAPSSIRQIHFCLSGALKRAMRWQWISVNPLDRAEPPRTARHNPCPPTPTEGAAILNAAFASGFAWGVLLWLAMTTGARRGELCALRWDGLDLDGAVLVIKTSIGQTGGTTWEKPTKTHQHRRIALDADTVALLRAYRLGCEADIAAVGAVIAADGRVFSPSLDHSSWVKPSTITQRYQRMCTRLGWDMHLHQLRHYSATELIASGVDVRTVAGRLGHGGGGSTTLRVYSAWISEADQKAAGAMGLRMPAPPIPTAEAVSAPAAEGLPPVAQAPYQRIVTDLRGAIACGALRPGELLPTMEELKSRYGVSAGTASRAVAQLKDLGLVSASRGRRATVRDDRSGAPE